MSNCLCGAPPFHFSTFDSDEIGDDGHWGEVSVETCKTCHAAWLRYLMEDCERSGSGRWWRVRIPADRLSDITVDNARQFIESRSEGFCGGSYFGSTGVSISGPIRVF